MFCKRQQFFNSLNSGWNIRFHDHLPGASCFRAGMQSRKVIIQCLFICASFSVLEVKAQFVKVELLSNEHYFSLLKSFQLSVKEQFDRIRNGIEFIKPVPGYRFLISVPQTNTEANDRPAESDKRRIGVEQQNKLTPEDSHKFWRLLLIQLVAFAVAFPVGAYFSLRARIRSDWRKHIPKGRLPKVSVLAMILILCLPRRIKSHRWQIWEQRHWFSDMALNLGFEAAYRDTWYWKQLLAKRW
ncbi:hypothetical protein [Kosakonia radicincitans]|uniref:hypothetical protein n=1 Tax=Kosakonia radicincitans TaxID=283686 RepID=UPI001181D07B|nr:hypothetical protein [Kosakonia radicincitans]